MLRIICPQCKNRISVEEALAGLPGSCPECGKRFRIPALKKPDGAAPVKKAPAPSPAAITSKPPRKPADSAFEVVEDHGDFEVVEDEPPTVQPAEDDERPSKKKTLKSKADKETLRDEEDTPRPKKRPSDDDEDDDDEPRPKKKKKKKKRGSSQAVPGLPNAVLALLIIGGIWMVMLLAVLFIPDLAFAVFILGLIIAGIGGIWFRIVLSGEDFMTRLLCSFVPFYDLYYIGATFEKAGKPAIIRGVGLVVLFTGLIVHAFHAREGGPFGFFGDGDDEEEVAGPLTAEDKEAKAILKDSGEEAREYLQQMGGRVVFFSMSNEQVKNMVEQLYQMGSKKVWLAGKGALGQLLIVEMPKDPKQRLALLTWRQNQNRPEGIVEMPPIKDDGSKYMIVEIK